MEALAPARLLMSNDERPGSPNPARLANKFPPSKLGILLNELNNGLFFGSKLLKLDNNLGSKVLSSLGSKPVKFERVDAKVFGSNALKLAKSAGFSPARFWLRWGFDDNTFVEAASKEGGRPFLRSPVELLDCIGECL